MATEEQSKPRVLVGDDQIGNPGDHCHKNFVYSYGRLADYDFTDNPRRFVEMARTGNYDALVIDLRWGPDIPREGYKVLEETRDYAKIRILHTSENEEARKLGYQHGATHCLEKGCLPEDLEKILKGGEE